MLKNLRRRLAEWLDPTIQSDRMKLAVAEAALLAAQQGPVRTGL